MHRIVFALACFCVIMGSMDEYTQDTDVSTNGYDEASSTKKLPTVLLGAGLAILLSTAAFFSGLHIGSGQVEPIAAEASLFSLFSSAEIDEQDLTEFWRVWELMDKKLPTSDEVTDEVKLHGAIQGLVRSYNDPYSMFLPPADAEQFEDDIAGNFSGVGMEVGMRDGAVTIIAPLPNTPAEEAGVLTGDVIVSIDEKSTEGMSIDQAVRLIRGEKGTEVNLEIYREGESALLDIAITRDNIEIPTIETSTDGDVFVIKLYSFNAISEMRMQNALREYVESGKSKLLLDLRGNPGGFLQSAVAIASFFLPAGEVIVRESFSHDVPERLFRSYGRTLREFAPDEMAILVDGGSASASEILAGALSEHGYATIIGSQTFGKGSVQELIDLPSGASLKVTVARWLTPEGVSISEGGISPEIEVERTREDVVEDRDPQYERAIEWFKER